MTNEGRALVAVAVLAMAGPGCKDDAQTEPGARANKARSQTPAAPQLDPVTKEALTKAAQALEHASADQRPMVAAAALAEAEANRLPAPLVRVLESSVQVDPSMRAMVMSKALAEPPLLGTFERICDSKAADVMKTAATTPADRKIDIVWDGCKLARHDLVTAAEAKTADFGSLLIAFVALGELKTLGGPAPEEKKLLRAMILDSARPEPDSGTGP